MLKRLLRRVLFHFFSSHLTERVPMKKLASLMLGLGLMVLSTGCYCSPYGYGYGGAPMGGGSPCGPGGCAPYQPGAMYTPYGGSYQATAPMPAAPMTAMGPMNALPTY